MILENNKIIHIGKEYINALYIFLQILEKKKAEIETNQRDISALKQELQQMTQMLHTYEQAISEKESNIQRMKAELTDLSRMRDMIFELTAKKKDDLNSS